MSCTRLVPGSFHPEATGHAELDIETPHPTHNRIPVTVPETSIEASVLLASTHTGQCVFQPVCI